MKIKHSVPLIHKQSERISIYFDFEKNVPYVQHLQGRAVKNEQYSSSDTYWLTWIFIGSASVLGLILDAIFSFPSLISIILSIALGTVLAKIVIRKYVSKSLGKREYKVFAKNEVVKLVPNVKRFWLIKGVYIFSILGLLFVIMLQLSHNEFRGQDFIMFIFGSFGIVFLHDTENPRKASKARKILKKQLKEGKFK